MAFLYKYRYSLLLGLCLLFLLPQESLMAQETVTLEKEEKEKLGGSGKEEDLFRFFGYEKPLAFRYLSLPYDSVMNTNLKEFTIEIGFVFLLLFPLGFFFSTKVKLKLWLPAMLFLLLYLCIAIGTSYIYQNGIEPENAKEHLAAHMLNQSFGEAPFASIRSSYQSLALAVYVPISGAISSLSNSPDSFTYPFLISLFFIVLVGMHFRFKSLELSKRSLLLFTFFYGALWLLLAAGLPWYGLMVFPLLIMISVYAWGNNNPDTWMPIWLKQGIFYTFAGIWLLMSLTYRMTNYDSSNETRAKQVFYPPLALYRNGTIEEEKVLDMFRRGYPEVARELNKETNSLIYHASTQIPYFIKKSDARCLADNYFEFFIKQKRKYITRTNLNKAFKIMGFKYFIIDLKLPMVDKTPKKSLTKKFNEFINYVYKNPEIELLMTDRQVERDGKVVNDVYLNNAQVKNAGTFALFRIKN